MRICPRTTKDEITYSGFNEISSTNVGDLATNSLGSVNCQVLVLSLLIDVHVLAGVQCTLIDGVWDSQVDEFAAPEL